MAFPTRATLRHALPERSVRLGDRRQTWPAHWEAAFGPAVGGIVSPLVITGADALFLYLNPNQGEGTI